MTYRAFVLSALLTLPLLTGCAAFKEAMADPVIYEKVSQAGEALGHAVANPANPVPWVELGVAVVGLVGAIVAGQKVGARAERNKLGLDRIEIPNDKKGTIK